MNEGGPGPAAAPPGPSPEPAPDPELQAAALALAREQLVQLQQTLELYYREAETLRAELARREARHPLRLLRRLAGRIRRRLFRPRD